MACLHSISNDAYFGAKVAYAMGGDVAKARALLKASADGYLRRHRQVLERLKAPPDRKFPSGTHGDQALHQRTLSILILLDERREAEELAGAPPESVASPNLRTSPGFNAGLEALRAAVAGRPQDGIQALEKAAAETRGEAWELYLRGLGKKDAAKFAEFQGVAKHPVGALLLGDTPGFTACLKALCDAFRQYGAAEIKRDARSLEHLCADLSFHLDSTALYRLAESRGMKVELEHPSLGKDWFRA
jgi:hypothetical protein